MTNFNNIYIYIYIYIRINDILLSVALSGFDNRGPVLDAKVMNSTNSGDVCDNSNDNLEWIELHIISNQDQEDAKKQVLYL